MTRKRLLIAVVTAAITTGVQMVSAPAYATEHEQPPNSDFATNARAFFIFTPHFCSRLAEMTVTLGVRRSVGRTSCVQRPASRWHSTGGLAPGLILGLGSRAVHVLGDSCLRSMTH